MLRVAFGLYARNVLALLGLVILASVPPVLWLLGIEAFAQRLADSDVATFLLVTLPAGLIGPACSYWLQAGVTYSVIRNLRGGRPTFYAMLTQALCALPQVVVAGFLTSIVLILGLLCFIVPGVVLFLMLWVAVPVAVVERRFGSALTRSHALTRGHKWSLLGLTFIMLVLWGVVLAVTIPIALLVFEIPEGPILFRVIWLVQTPEIPVMVAGMIVQSVWATVLAVGYHHLRVLEEGPGSAIARVFD